MPCSCGRTICECEGECRCCPYACHCEQCLGILRRQGAHCSPCGGYITPYMCTMIPVWRQTGRHPNYPNLYFLRTRTRQPNTASDESSNALRSAPDVTQSSSTSSQRSASEVAQNSSIASRSASEVSQISPRENRTFDDSLIFQMDDIDFSPEVSTNMSTGANSRDVQGNSHFGSNTSDSDTPLEFREPPSRVRRCYHHGPDTAGLKWSEHPKCKMPIWTPLQQPDDATGSKWRESQIEASIAPQDVAGCSNQSPGTGISEIEESRVTGVPRLRTDLNRTEMIETEMQTSQGDPGCSHRNSSNISKLEESRVTDNSAEQKSDEISLKRTESHEKEIIKKDIPSVCDSSEPTELQSSEQNQSTGLCTSEQSPTSNLSKLETLRISDIRSIDKSRTPSETSSSIEVIPGDMPNGARCDAFHGQPGIISNSVASSQLNNSAIQAESTQPGTSQILSTSNSLESPSPEVSNSPKQRESTALDSSIETTEQTNGSSKDGTPTNKSPKTNN